MKAVCFGRLQGSACCVWVFATLQALQHNAYHFLHGSQAVRRETVLVCLKGLGSQLDSCQGTLCLTPLHVPEMLLLPSFMSLQA